MHPIAPSKNMHMEMLNGVLNFVSSIPEFLFFIFWIEKPAKYIARERENPQYTRGIYYSLQRAKNKKQKMEGECILPAPNQNPKICLALAYLILFFLQLPNISTFFGHALHSTPDGGKKRRNMF